MKTDHNTLCRECLKGEYREETGDIYWENKFLGPFELKEVKYFICDNCSNKLYSYDTVKLRKKEENRSLDEWLCAFIISPDDFDSKFMTCGELVKELGITRQAINKNPRYKNLIYNIMLKGETFYLRESVLKFKEKGDGRIKIFDESMTIQQDDKSSVIMFPEETSTTGNIVDYDYAKTN